MCGIFACVCNQSTINKINTNESIRHLLCRRGPDQFAKLQIPVNTDYRTGTQICLMSSGLQLRGRQLCDQPLMDSNGNVLQWNGQVFGGIEIKVNESDTDVLMNRLSQCKTDEEVLGVLSLIRGPWSLTYWDNNRKCFWFGRDILGRRSLCWTTGKSDELLIISSITHYDFDLSLEWEELPANGVYCLDFSTDQPLIKTVSQIKHFGWDRRISGTKLSADTCLTSPITVPMNRSLPSEEVEEEISQEVIDGLTEVLSESVRKRCLNQQGLCKKCFIRSVDQTNETNGDDLTNGDGFSSDSEGDILGTSPNLDFNTNNNVIDDKECSHASTAILFSGGIDSTVIALMADRCVPKGLPIDLLNVAFDSEAPDRQTGLEAWDELKTLRPNRRWNFVSIYVSKEELQTMRDKHIKHLVRPSHTVLDDSIGCALWFAATGKGLLMEEHEVTSVYETPARVVLLGMGADEQLAGYNRHRRVFDKEGWSGLIDEMALEVDRLSSRNLGRDDRVTSDHGREPRYPFLDEKVIEFLNGTPVWQKCDLRLDRSEGEKLLLRKVADKLGLIRTAHHLKRAIQFGSRIAKLEERGLKGDHMCHKLNY